MSKIRALSYQLYLEFLQTQLGIMATLLLYAMPAKSFKSPGRCLLDKLTPALPERGHFTKKLPSSCKKLIDT
jgi:hypothetical protein